METLLPISYLNDFVFCPYSIYLHQVFDNSIEDVYSALPQQRGKTHHSDVDTFEPIKNNNELKGIYVVSNQLGLYGKIDTLYLNEKKLVEKKYNIKTIYRGYYYQLWAQYYGLIEMGYDVKHIEFYSIKENKTYLIPLPGEREKTELKQHIKKIANFDFETEISVNIEKCVHCIYATLCDKTNQDHVYS